MATGRNAREIKRVRNEVLIALKVLYPAAMQADQLLRSLLVLFPNLEFDPFRRDLHYLCEKGYIERVAAHDEADPDFTAWRRRWFKLTTAGMEIADHCVSDPAMHED